MASGDEEWRAQFPALYAESRVEYANCRLRYTVAPAPDELVSRLHLVAVTSAAEVVVCRSEQGWRFLPGGTREPGENLEELARRELREEAGAALCGRLHPFAAHVADSADERPYRPHLPHPRAYWAYACCRVRLTGPPTNPPDGERVIEVKSLTVAEAVRYLRVHDAMHADVLCHADAMGLIATAPTGQALRRRTGGPRPVR